MGTKGSAASSTRGGNKQPRRNSGSKNGGSNANSSNRSGSGGGAGAGAGAGGGGRFRYGSVRRLPTYRWITEGEGSTEGGGKGGGGGGGRTNYSALEVVHGGHRTIVRVGDSVLLYSGDAPGEEAEQGRYGSFSGGGGGGGGGAGGGRGGRNGDGRRDRGGGKGGGGGRSSTSGGASAGDDDSDGALYIDHHSDEDEEETYYGNHSDDNFYGVDSLDPFIARVESMWEDPPPPGSGRGGRQRGATAEEKDKHNYERKMRMKIRARWYFKKEDIEGINGHFLGVQKKALLNAMGPRDLVLGEQTDDNEVPTLVGKCTVIRRNPSSLGGNGGGGGGSSVTRTRGGGGGGGDGDAPRSAYTCNYDIRIPQKGEPGFGSVVVVPFRGGDGEESRKGKKRQRVEEEGEDTEQDEGKNGKRVKSSEEKEEAEGNTANDARRPSDNKSASKETSSDGEREEATGDKKTNIDDKRSTANDDDANDAKPQNDDCDPSDESKPNNDGTIDPKNTSLNKNDGEDGDDRENAEGANSANENSLTGDEEDDPPMETGDKNNADKTEDGAPSLSASSSVAVEEDDDDASGYSGRDRNNLEDIIDDNMTGGEEGRSPKKGVIHVDDEHQAAVPPLSSLKRPSGYRVRSKAKLVWTPGRLSDEKLNSFLSEACLILKDYVQSQGEAYEFGSGSGSVEYCVEIVKNCNNADTNTEQRSTTAAEGDESESSLTASRKKRLLARECNEDALLDELSKYDYNVDVTLARIRREPKRFLTLWSDGEKEKFDVGFRRYCGSLRMISKGVPSKNTKAVVDYHYRFKIPDQFRKYQEQKREQARRMMATADMRLMDGAGKSGSSTKKVRNWGKGGATEQRRLLAKDFLLLVRDTVGSEKYLEIAQCLKQYHAKSYSVTMLKEKITDVLETQPDLLDRFQDFLPKKFRTTAAASD